MNKKGYYDKEGDEEGNGEGDGEGDEGDEGTPLRRSPKTENFLLTVRERERDEEWTSFSHAEWRLVIKKSLLGAVFGSRAQLNQCVCFHWKNDRIPLGYN